MKKLIVGIAVLGTIVFGVAPFITGIVAENQTSKEIDKVNALATRGTMETLQYDRGITNSETSYRIVFNEAHQNQIGLKEISFTCDVDHGVIGVDYSCKIINDAYKAFIDENLAGKDPLTLESSVSVFGGIESTILIDKTSLDLADGAKISLPKKASIQISRDGSEYGIEGEIPSLTIDEKGSLNIDDVVIKGSLEKINEGLFTGNVVLKGNKIELFNKVNSSGMLLDDFEIKTKAKEKNAALFSTLTFSADSMDISTTADKKNVFSSPSFDFGVSGVNTQAYLEYYETMQELYKLYQFKDLTKQAEVSAKLLPVVEKMLQENLGFSIETSFKLDGKRNKILFDLTLLKNMTLAELSGFIFNPEETLKNFKGNLNIDIKKNLIEKYPQLALSTSKVPAFMQTKKGIELNMELDSGLKVNGKKTSIAELQGLFN